MPRHDEGAEHPGGEGGAPTLDQLPNWITSQNNKTVYTAQGLSLRPYQQAAVDEIRAAFGQGLRRVLLQSPTGSGKTAMFTHGVNAAAARGKRVCILVHKRELVRQSSATLDLLGIRHGRITAGQPVTDEPVQVAMVQTLARRLEKGFRIDCDLLIIDEAHHAVADTWASILKALPDAYVLGCTATPERLDGKGLGDIFQVLIKGPSVIELMRDGWLVPAEVYAPAKAPDLSGVSTRGGDYDVAQLAEKMVTLTGDAVAHYRRLCSGVPAIAFCVNIAHSKDVAQRFRDAGFRAEHVDGNTPDDKRRELIAALGNGELDVLCNCGLISEGVDIPVVGAAILLRPTQSLAMYLQMVGRVLRPAPGKTKAIILDHAGNSLLHGLPDAPRQWSLDGRPKRQRSYGVEVPIRRCDCGAVNPREAMVCQVCGEELKRTPAEIREIEALLVLQKRNEQFASIAAMSYRQRLEWAGANSNRLRLVAEACGYKSGWAWLRLQEIKQEQNEAVRA
jgi:DNA repair protein RadD